MILNIIHVNVNVTDIERSLDFYRKVGFQVLHVFGDRPTDDVREGMAFRGGRMRGVVLGISDDPRATTRIELVQWVDPRSGPAPKRSQYDAGVSRIAIRTKNLLAQVESLREKGIRFLSEPQEIDIVGAKRFVLFEDPDGTLLELIEL
jgi:catechol 2,3-dioxygenase-like lactoylglutathione lyase family enzyme